MTELDIAPNFGAELKDCFKPVNTWVSNGIAWLDDIQQFYRERSAIEKEYADKLSALAKKYFEKKSRKLSTLSVGDTPTITPGSLESASMTTWTVQLTTLEQRANEHSQYSTQLISKLADPVKHLQTRYEDLRKAHADYAGKLEKERDSAYAELRKQKGKYDSVCQEVENKRKKTESSFDHGKAKARNAFDSQQLEMRNVKNLYLISINVTNKQKERYYHEYVPDLLDSLQDLNEGRVAKLNSLWLTAAQLETDTLSRSTQYLNHLSGEIPRNNPLLDSMMFVRHNASNWQDPPDFTFEPSPVWLDDGNLATDDQAVTFLRNVLVKSKGSLAQLRRDLEKKRQDIEAGKRVKQNIREGKDKRDEVEIVRGIFYLQEAMHEIERQKITAEVEVLTITAVVGDVSIGAKNHNFKSQTFKIPTNCDLCGERIWGLSAKGFDCRDCGYTCHSKCEMKVPADCPGEQTKEEQKKLKAQRQAQASVKTPLSPTNGTSASSTDLAGNGLARSNTVNSMNTLSSGYSANPQRSVSGAVSPSPVDEERPAAAKPAPRTNRILAPPPTQYVKDSGTDFSSTSSEPRGKMLYAYQENGEGEITVSQGKDVVILEPDDGSGWMKVRSGVKEGLVPASYVEALPALTPPPTASSISTMNRPASTYSSSSISLAGSVAGSGTGAAKKKGPAVAPRRGAKKLKYVEALYDYTAQSDAEHSMAEGERFVLSNMDAGDGWADVEKGGVVKSVPANYIQEV